MELPKHKIDALRNKMKNLRLRSGKDIFFDVTFIKGEEKVKLMEQSPISELKALNKILQVEEYEQIKIEIFNGAEKPISSERIILSTPKAPEGLGDVERMKFEQFYQEKERERSYVQMQEELEELSDENLEYETIIEEQNKTILELQTALANKSNFRHYAGMIAETLGKIGVKSEKLNNITGLLGIDDFTSIHDEAPLQIAQHEEVLDSSGIVEEKEPEIEPQDKRKLELIQLMADSMYTMEISDLNMLFAVFSEVEKKPQLSKDVLLFLNNKIM